MLSAHHDVPKYTSVHKVITLTAEGGHIVFLITPVLTPFL